MRDEPEPPAMIDKHRQQILLPGGHEQEAAEYGEHQPHEMGAARTRRDGNHGRIEALLPRKSDKHAKTCDQMYNDLIGPLSGEIRICKHVEQHC